MNKPAMVTKYFLTVLGLLLPAISHSTPPRVLQHTAIISAPVAEVWDAWTTQRGITAFFSPQANIDLQTDGLYEIVFYPGNAPGQRGAEGNRVLAVEPPARFAFTWDAPPAWPGIRSQRTMVEIRLQATPDGQTRLQLNQFGWGDGRDWDAVFAYFKAAWSVILKRLQYRFEHGPINWNNVPDGLLYPA